MKKTRVMGFGTFDGLHPGHRSFLKQLRRLGDELFVVVARDANVTKLKGHHPDNPEQERQKALEKTGLADRVVLGNPTHFYQCLLDHRPGVVGLGYDQRADTAAIETILPGVKIIRLKPYRPKKYKSSLLAKQPKK